jgi:DNA repair protein RadC
VFQGAILLGAVALIISHNHPSGDETPSPEDRTLTSRLKDAAHLMGIKILDHVIVTNSGFHSLADEGLL